MEPNVYDELDQWPAGLLYGPIPPFCELCELPLLTLEDSGLRPSDPVTPER
jgi:hypothetical protein